MARKRYPTDLTDPEWERLALVWPPESGPSIVRVSRA